MTASSKTRSEMFAQARARTRRALEEMIDEEDAAITRDAEADPDARPMTDEEFVRAQELGAKRIGRPRSTNPKVPVNVRLDAEVLESLKAGGRGWQTRMNAILRRALGLG
jgi:uncharacterized protein (DUF4415 family)